MALNSFLKKSTLLSIASTLALAGFCGASNAGSMLEAANAQCTGTVVDNFYLKPLALSVASSSLVDRHGNFFVSGGAYDNTSICHWIVRKSTDGGTTWTTVDDYEYSPGAQTSNDLWPALGQDNQGNIYVAGFDYNAAGDCRWIVRKSADDGATWVTVDDFDTNGSTTRAMGVSSDLRGNVYVAGYGSIKKTGYHWFVRKSSDGGNTWKTVDDYQMTAGQAAEAASVASDGRGNIYCAGSANNRWVVRKSADAGATWTTVDSFRNGTNIAGARSVVSDSGNYIYAAGGVYASTSGNCKWVVRRSLDAGQTWETVEEFQLVEGQFSEARDIWSDANGYLYVTGYGKNENGYNWITRKSTDHGGSWETIDTFQFKPGKMGMGRTVWTDANGEVFTGGMASSRWVVRKISCE